MKMKMEHYTMSNPNSPRSALPLEDVRKVSPALENYTRTAIEDGLWNRPGLSPRDRSIVTAAALIARNQTVGMLHYFNTALDNNVKPSELSENHHASCVLLRLVECFFRGSDYQRYL